jgi:hypothetical protein
VFAVAPYCMPELPGRAATYPVPLEGESLSPKTDFRPIGVTSPWLLFKPYAPAMRAELSALRDPHDPSICQSATRVVDNRGGCAASMHFLSRASRAKAKVLTKGGREAGLMVIAHRLRDLFYRHSTRAQ